MKIKKFFHNLLREDTKESFTRFMSLIILTISILFLVTYFTFFILDPTTIPLAGFKYPLYSLALAMGSKVAQKIVEKVK